MARSLDFYTGILGFQVVFMHGDPAYYGQIARDRAKLNLRLISEPVYAGDIRAREQLLSASMTVDDIGALEAELGATSVPLHQLLRLEPWGARTLIVRDPDGNLLLFAGS